MPTHTAKHICNSHKPAHKSKIAKELVCFPTLTLPTLKKLNLLRNRKRND